MKLSVCIITKNEEEELPRCLESIKHIADEIIVVDDNSTDKTKEIAKKYGSKLYERTLDTFANQKNYALEKATGDWILAIDADEILTPELEDEIKEILEHDEHNKDLRFRIQDSRRGNGLKHKIGQINGYLIPRRNIILGAEIKYTRWSPDKHIWLFRKEKGKWVGDIHEEVEIEGWTGELQNAKIHYQYETVADFFAMLNNYTEREANQLVKQGKKFSYFQLFYAPFLSFSRRFIYKKGFLDGWRGFVLSYMMAIYRMTTWIKVWEKTN